MTQRMNHLNPDTLNAFIDGELPATEHQEIQQHLTSCHSCTLRVLSATQLKGATARAGHRFAPPPEALARLTAQLRSQQQTNSQPQTRKPARILPIGSIAWAGLAAAILIAISLLGWRQIHQTDTLATELLDQHLAALSSGASPQVISTDRHTVKPWFQGRLPFSFNLSDATALPPDTVLKGADLAYVNGQPAAMLLYTIHKHQVSIFLTQRTQIPILVTLPATREGFNLRSATTASLRLIAVSDVNQADLDRLVAALIQAQASP
jgi:anti-sigma factor RsiW